MDLEKQTKIIPSAKTGSSSNLAGEPTLVSLFDAVRKWTDAEGVNAFYIELDGNRLTPEQIQVIAHSEAYKDRLAMTKEPVARCPPPQELEKHNPQLKHLAGSN